MKKIAIIGASGYTGGQLAALLDQGAGYQIQGLYVSEQSQVQGKALKDLYPAYQSLTQVLKPLNSQNKADILAQADAVALATDHHVSVELAAWCVEHKLPVFDLSGAYRFADKTQYPAWYGFEHPYPKLLQQAVYGLAEWNADKIAGAALVAVPGCYPTASLLALKPVAALLDPSVRPVINAVSGVTGAGRKALPHTSFCEVSLTPYGVLGHRHQPEIATQLGAEVIFTPHLGNFKRGILATITVKLLPGITQADLRKAFSCYDQAQCVHVLPEGFPKVDDVACSSQCLIGWMYDETSQYLVIGSAIDNLMKGAASQALQCIKIHFENS
ncbi:MAG: N-acetyl-gamma-glutamyl-phosphate reductase [Shewanella sp.]|nr:N-acetyl-gamma-glutamyl-phosphate reductase [Shewanella sp.]MCF1431171.1 N-acetyl-gamma-glutamyl-phosphate reductase [Shewanella sp.]MCF1438499.1 N-acetyl-gamma-glutamyl-phosphate reductase [Shewanella sp.]MCF1457105.1 N-acetyl-gamma-glutamyl-phosphate reductase [Shewanella sp.]